jgi:ABC-type branched-subunit amino acid transport system substrate-binding protein
MKVSNYAESAFKDYFTPLSALEKAFRDAGVDIVFRGMYTDNGGKLVEILRSGFSDRIVSIEGDNPGQAIKDVANAVKL